jgi:uncharacterized 2Fe-2S/4Fe-4S cluster protein (DUF4445 family)
MSERKTPEHLVIFMPSGRRGRVPDGTLVLDAARQLGVEIESICGGRLTCNKCRIKVEEGAFAKHGIVSANSHLSPPTEEETRLLNKLESPECRLSCNARICDDALIFVPEESRAHKQVVRKAATERVIALFPAVRQVYVEVEQAELGKHLGDWGRLQKALAEQWDLHDLTVGLPVLRDLQANLRKKKWAVTVTLWQEKEVIDVQPGYAEGVYGLAVDIGSTTIAGFLCDLRTGDILATDSMMNPQVTYGEDLMSRVSYAMMHNDGLDKMNTAVIQALNRLAASTAKQAGIRPRHIQEAVFVGNTTMIHILLGISPIELGGAPFALANRDAIDVKARELGLRLHRSGNVHILPAEAGHVGADNVAALIAEEPYNQDAVTLLIDVGTNAEIVLGNKEWMLSASSPTGPAFEGAQIRFGMRAAPGAIERVRIDPKTKVARFRVIGEEKWSDEWQMDAETPTELQPNHLAAGICGSGIIEVVAEMFLAGILLPDGRFNPNSSVKSEQLSVKSERVQWEGRRGAYILATAEQSTTGSPILVTQDDVRNIQLAKAALYAGAKLLMNEAKLTKVDRIVLAGAFGSFIDPKYAMILGLIPDCDLAQVTAVGNAAGDGARIALLNRHKREEAQRISKWVRYVETAVHPNFQDEFVGAIHLPHASDAFPHLNGLLPKVAPIAENGNGRPKRRRRKKKRLETGE